MNRRGALGLTALPLALAPAAAAGRTPTATSTTAGAAPVVLAGAVGDGASHRLSSRYRTLAAARADYPHATALTDEIDWCALQGAINAVDTQGGAVHVPNTGRPYVLNRGLVLNPNKVTLRGDGSGLDFRQLAAPGSRAVWFKDDGAPHYGHEKHVFEGFELVGPGRQVPHVAGLFFHTDTPALSSRGHVRDCAVHDFASG